MFQHSMSMLKKKRNQPGNPDPDAEVVAMSPKSLMATNRFVCEICNKGFQRDQNLQLHRRGHNLPWKLRQKSNKEVMKKKVYVCPESTCVHHHPSRALGDLTGIKKHYCRKHGEKKWKCDRCSKRYAVLSDWKAHLKTCGTKEYTCDCGTLFSRKDSFLTHRAFCDALAQESATLISMKLPHELPQPSLHHELHSLNPNPKPNPSLSAMALLQKATAMRSFPLNGCDLTTWRNEDRPTRDFIGAVDVRVGNAAAVEAPAPAPAEDNVEQPVSVAVDPVTRGEHTRWFTTFG
ncbi:protein indeterminate-domain 12-like isoform X1 [Dioscorea cayenensis subsp. rotundata]|uniref:Protein EARLY HEADING DATE 2 n=1 Tax=Dioscorea cayennensis subsp. rotundata TaxID=55577 RepID=A0AB40CCH3_DIOCR|nr:protein indeterminate-domain 12-like isoform X1 [Dioscorea cayenensis subsp. rotundata]